MELGLKRLGRSGSERRGLQLAQVRQLIGVLDLFAGLGPFGAREQFWPTRQIPTKQTGERQPTAE